MVEKRFALTFFGVFLLGFAATLFIQYGYSHKFGTDWSRLLHVDAASDLGRIVVDDFGAPLSTGTGHDGMWSYLIARDPWCSTPLCKSLHTTSFADSYGFRYRRLFYSVLAGGFGAFSPAAALWGLILLAAAGVGMTVAAHAVIAEKLRLPLATTALIPALPGLIEAACILTSDCLALGLSALGICAYLSSRFRMALVLFSMATLTKEVYWLAAAGCALHELCKWNVRRTVLIAIVPAAPLGLWIAWMMVQGFPLAASTYGDLGWPLRGIWILFTREGNLQHRDILEPVLTLTMLPISVVLALLSRNKFVLCLLLPWIVLGLTLTAWIWRPTGDAARGLLPVWILALWGLLLWIRNHFQGPARQDARS